MSIIVYGELRIEKVRMLQLVTGVISNQNRLVPCGIFMLRRTCVYAHSGISSISTQLQYSAGIRLDTTAHNFQTEQYRAPARGIS